MNIPIEGGYFLNKTVGFEYGKKEELYLKYLSQQRIRWKKMKFESKESKFYFTRLIIYRRINKHET